MNECRILEQINVSTHCKSQKFLDIISTSKSGCYTQN